jgi:transcriptional regulator with XRE-family HTH domain
MITILIACVVVLFVALLLAVYVGISSSNDARKAWNTLAAANAANSDIVNELLETHPAPKLFDFDFDAMTPRQQIDTHRAILNSPLYASILRTAMKSDPAIAGLTKTRLPSGTWKKSPSPHPIDLGKPIAPQQVPQYIKAMRASRSWSQGQLARESGISQGGLCKIEQGRYSSLQTSSIQKLVDTFAEPLTLVFTPRIDFAKPKGIDDAHTRGCTCEACLNPNIVIEPHVSQLDALRDAVHAALSDYMADEVAPPKVSYGNGRYRIECILWGDALLTYDVPVGEPLATTVANVLAKAGPMLVNPFS